MGSIAKKFSNCVLPGVLLVRASPDWEQILLIALDLPAFDRPANATSASLSAGHSDKTEALVKNWVCLKFMSYSHAINPNIPNFGTCD